jgi:uracil-DNA glycosylase
MQGEAPQQLRAWVDYFRDLGIYDFYRNGEPVGVAADEARKAVDQVPVASAPSVSIAAESAVIPAQSDAEWDSLTAVAEQSSPHFASTVTKPSSIADTVPSMPLISFDKLAPLPAESIPANDRAAALQAIRDYIGDCTRCPLAYAGRRTIVFGDGSPSARLMFVGEGPGADEDTQGIPFVGKAGQLLNNMITAMGLARTDVYIANIVKCRPPANRVPEPVEANTCSQFLLRQIDVVQPEVIVALGSTAATYLLGVKRSLSALRGHWHSCRGAKLAVTYHPAFLLRDPRMKAEAWKDLQMVMAELGLQPPARK